MGVSTVSVCGCGLCDSVFACVCVGVSTVSVCGCDCFGVCNSMFTCTCVCVVYLICYHSFMLFNFLEAG